MILCHACNRGRRLLPDGHVVSTNDPTLRGLRDNDDDDYMDLRGEHHRQRDQGMAEEMQRQQELWRQQRDKRRGRGAASPTHSLTPSLPHSLTPSASSSASGSVSSVTREASHSRQPSQPDADSLLFDLD
jgi:hypothetical protein